jgi:transposase-like protein
MFVAIEKMFDFDFWENKCPDCYGKLKTSITTNHINQNDYICTKCRSVFNYQYITGVNDGYEAILTELRKMSFEVSSNMQASLKNHGD